MTDLEYAQERIAQAEHTIDNLMIIVANALPHTHGQLRNLAQAWDEARQALDAQRKAGSIAVSIITSPSPENEISHQLNISAKSPM